MPRSSRKPTIPPTPRSLPRSARPWRSYREPEVGDEPAAQPEVLGPAAQAGRGALAGGAQAECRGRILLHGPRAALQSLGATREGRAPPDGPGRRVRDESKEALDHVRPYQVLRPTSVHWHGLGRDADRRAHRFLRRTLRRP